jgi:hypothetical protein
LTADDKLKFEIIPFDEYDNLANSIEEELNIDVFIPGCADSSSGECTTTTYSVEKDEKT